MISIDRYAYKSKLASIDPKAKMAFAFTPLLLCLLLDSYIVSIVTLFLISLLTIYFAGISVLKFLKYLAVPFGFLIIGVLTIIINRTPDDAGVIIGAYGYGVTYSSLFLGLKLALRAIAAVSCMYFLSFNTPMNAIFGTLENSPLPKLIVSLMQLIYRYIFIVQEEAARIRTAQLSRLGYGNFRSYITCAGELAGQLFLRAYKRSDMVYAALESRAFSGSFNTLPDNYAKCPMLYAGASAFAALLILIKLSEGFIS